jgi:hypothetical protein
VLRFREVATPASAEDEVLIRLFASSVNPLEDGHAQGKFVITIRHGEDVSGCDELQPFSTSKLGATEAPGRLLGITKP